MKYWKTCAAIVLTCFNAVSETNTNSLANVTLEQALDLAERSHPLLTEARAQVEASAGRANQVGQFPNPDLIARMESAPFKGRTTGEAEYLAGISQTVPLSSRLSKAREAERFESDRRRHDLEATRRDLHKRVRSAFATALYQEKASQTQTEIVAGADKLAAATRARLNAGDAVAGDLARAEMELARTDLESNRIAAMRQQAVAGLAGSIGMPQLSIASLSGDLEAAFEIPTLESLSADLRTHPAIAASAAEIRSRQTRLDLAQAERIPDIKVELLYRRIQPEERDGFDLGISIPLPLFNRNQGRLREASAELAVAEARSRLVENDLAVRLSEAEAQFSLALSQARDLKEKILPLAETIRRAAEARYAAGDIDLGQVVQVQRDWAAIQLSYLESLRDVMQAWANLASLHPPAPAAELRRTN